MVAVEAAVVASEHPTPVHCAGSMSAANPSVASYTTKEADHRVLNPKLF